MKYVFGIIIAALVFGGCFGYFYSDKFYPNTYVNGVSVGGMTLDEAREKIKPALEDIKANGFNLEFAKEKNVRKVNIPASASGFTPDTVVEYFSVGDIDKTINDAYDRGRQAFFLRAWLSKASSLVRKKTFTVPHGIQKEAVFSLLGRELNGFLSSPADAEFAVNEGVVSVIPGKYGADMDFQKIYEGMEAALDKATLEGLKFEVNLINPPLVAADLEPKLNFVQALINKPVNLEFLYDTHWWRARGPVFASWITLSKDGKDKIEIKDDKLKNFFQLYVDYTTEGKMVNSRFEMENGKLVEIVPGKAGLEVNFEKLKADIEAGLGKIYEKYRDNKKIASEDKALRINFDVEKVEPKITKETIQKYGITDLIGKAQTSFAGSSAARINNIKIGASQLNGILLAPGEEFSAVAGIGKVDEEAGYKKEYVIKVDKSVQELGGGLCQVGTTLFRMALDAGLPITERQNHSYVVGYYGPGLDATIYGPSPDLKFVNDTGNYILLQGMTEGNNLIFELYGKKDGRKSFISEARIKDVISPAGTKYIMTADLPLAEIKCTEHRRNGLTAEVDYRVEYANLDVREQTFVSVYKPWQEVCLFGTKF